MNARNIFPLLLLMAVACGTSTQITAVWRSPDNKKVYQNICIAATTGNVTAKQIVEEEMNKQFRKRGIRSSKLSDLLPKKFIGDSDEKEMILNEARKNGSDAILAFALIRQKEESHYVPGMMQYAPYNGYYGTWGGYYGYYGNRMYAPGYYTQDEVYYIESDLYDTKTEKLVWSVQSATYNPSGIQQFAQEFTEVITKQLIKSNIILPEVK